MARKKIEALDKREQIVKAFMECVLELGFERASMGEVSAKVGLDRSSMYHYFPTKDALVEDAVRNIAQDYLARLDGAIARFSTAARAHQLVEHLFGPDFHRPMAARLIDELNAAANRDKTIERCVTGIYRAVEAAIVQEIDDSYPQATAKSRREVAYAISQLAEGCAVFTSMGFGVDRRLAARNVSLKLLEELEGARATRTSNGMTSRRAAR